jgi:hypothetical protein
VSWWPVTCQWRGAFTNAEVNALHAEAFETAVFDESEWNWAELVHRHSLGWVVARDGAGLVGFVNVLGDGLVRAWLQDVMVAAKARGRRIPARGFRGPPDRLLLRRLRVTPPRPA